MKFRRALAAAALLACSVAASAGVDPLTARVDDSAAQRFAKLWRATGGKPTAEQIKAQYLQAGGRGIEVFTPGRIVDAERLARTVAAAPELYRDAIERCLPWVQSTNAELRSSYLGLRGLLPDRPLPEIAVVIGADNSGGTAAPGIQVIGLEVICRLSPTRAAFEDTMRQFFTHETVHTFQPGEQDSTAGGLLSSALQEGVPDYVTLLVTGRPPNPDRDAWARPREAQIWKDFQADATTIRAGTDAKGQMNQAAKQAYLRWFSNAGSAPKGLPDELGYWVGMRIAEAYVAASADPHRAIDELIAMKDPAAILKKSGYAPR